MSGLPGSASAADTGQFLFTNAAPLPVAAGGSLFLSGVAVNQGSEVWAAANTSLVAEIYDRNRSYIVSVDNKRPAADVAPGGSLRVDLTFQVPIDYQGDYSFRLFVVHNNQRIVQSDYRSFPVTPQALPPGAATAVPRGGVPLTVGGTVVVSYKNDTSPNGWLAETNVNLSGKADGRPYDFNANTFHDRNNHSDLRTILLNYHGAAGDLGLGDVSPNFSPLSVSGAGVRGGLVKAKPVALGPVKWGIDAVAAQAAAPVEGSPTSNGIYQRMMYGAQSTFLLPASVTLRGNYVQLEDDGGSINTPGPSLTPVSNQSAGGGATWTPSKDFKLEGDWQASSFQADKTSTAAALSGTAWRAAGSFARPRWSLTATAARNGSNFQNLAAPGVAKDRMSYDSGLMLRPWDWLVWNNTFSQFRDNLDNDPAKSTSRQRALGSNADLLFPTRTRVKLGYTYNRATASPGATQDNKTNGASLGVNQSWGTGSLDAGWQRSQFTDFTAAAHNLLTNSFNVSWNCTASKKVSTTLGWVLNDTRDEKSGSSLRTQTYSASVNGNLSTSLSMRGFASLTDTTNDDPANRADTRDTNLNLETTWKATKALSLTGGVSRTSSGDSINSANNRIVRGVTVRAGYTF